MGAGDKFIWRLVRAGRDLDEVSFFVRLRGPCGPGAGIPILKSLCLFECLERDSLGMRREKTAAQLFDLKMSTLRSLQCTRLNQIQTRPVSPILGPVSAATHLFCPLFGCEADTIGHFPQYVSQLSFIAVGKTLQHGGYQLFKSGYRHTVTLESRLQGAMPISAD